MFGLTDDATRALADAYLDWLEEQARELGSSTGLLHYALADTIDEDRCQVGLSDDPPVFARWLDAARGDDPEEDDE
jgi:hypothetical protein